MSHIDYIMISVKLYLTSLSFSFLLCKMGIVTSWHLLHNIPPQKVDFVLFCFVGLAQQKFIFSEFWRQEA